MSWLPTTCLHDDVANRGLEFFILWVTSFFSFFILYNFAGEVSCFMLMRRPRFPCLLITF
jgi:hypothetical protein